MATIVDEIKESFRKGSVLTKLIYINLGVFLLVNLAFVIFFLGASGLGGFQAKRHYFDAQFLTYLQLPASLSSLLYKPWTLFTYMFLHFDFLHILFNMIMFFWFGRIFMQYLTERQLLNTYLLGGLAGGVLYVIAFNIFPGLMEMTGEVELLGASAAITAIIIAISVYAPNYAVYIPIAGPVKLKYLAIIFFVIDLILVASDNSGGYISHIGGAIYGFIFALQLRKGKDMGKSFGKVMDSVAGLFKPRTRLRVSYKKSAKEMDDMEYNRSKADQQREIDRILDKIAKSGYDSLTKKEKETLFKMSNNN